MPDHRIRKPARQHGTGALIVRKDSAGRETFYGKWRAKDGRQVKRRLGPKREPGTRAGLTKTQAEVQLRRLMGEDQPSPVARDDHRTIAEVAEVFLAERENDGCKRTTLGGYRSMLKAHLIPFFRERAVDRITDADVAALDRKLRDAGRAVETRRHLLRFLGAILELAVKKGWATHNPAAGHRKPRKGRSAGGELQFLTLEEVAAVVRSIPDDALGRVERALYMAAAMTGLRRGELLGLRWRDVDWSASAIRVVQTWVLGRMDTPKSETSRRSVPLADELAGELQRLYDASAFQADDDLVFVHPATRKPGTPLDGSAVYKRFRLAVKRAGVRPVRFHDLRHTFGTMMARTEDLVTVKAWMGHADIETTMRYAHYAPRGREAERVGQAFAGLAMPVAEPVAVGQDQGATHLDKFTGPITFEPVTVETALRWLGIAGLDDEKLQREAVKQAVIDQRLFPLHLTALRDAGWLQPED